MKSLSIFSGLILIARFALGQCVYGDCQNGIGHYKYPEGHHYYGQFSSGQLSGVGVFYFGSGDYYVGQLANSLYQGYGTYVYKAGNLDRGFWQNGTITQRASGETNCAAGYCQSGVGIYVFTNGDQYHGGFSSGACSGQGIYLFANGEKYIGDFMRGKRHGRGTYFYNNGRVDAGNWDNDQLVGGENVSKTTNNAAQQDQVGCSSGNCNNGQGTYVFDDGSKFVGNFLNGKLHGQGTYTTTKGERYVGEFRNGMYNGYGTYYYNNGTVNEGQWENNEFRGSLAAARTGCVSGDCQNGTGTYAFSEGHRYVGAFRNGTFNGQGNYTFVTGDRYVGQFQNNKFHGQGKYTFVSGRVQDGLWADNQFMGNVSAQIQQQQQQNNASVQQNGGNQQQNNTTVQQNGSATNERRLALVIGNSAYTNAGALKNPVNDARSMELALREMGFDVIKLENATRDEMIRGMNQFGERLKSYDVGLFFFAGHGLQTKGNNYVVPVTADIKAENEVELECVEANRVLAKMESARNRLNIIVLDACRNNPFERSWNRNLNGNGLASMNAPVGSFIAYATAPGSTASDGSGQNGLYTEQLLKYMRQPNLKIEDVFKQVRINVMKLSGNEQTPWEASSLMGDFFFKK
jgi:hypothetical protein